MIVSVRESVRFGLLLFAVPIGAQEPPSAPPPDRAAAALEPLDAERPETGGRPPPTLERMGAGYVYRGGPFDAYIHPDGRLQFHDHFPIRAKLPVVEGLRLQMTPPRDRPVPPSYGDATDDRIPAIVPRAPAPTDRSHGPPAGYLEEIEQARTRVAEDGRDLRLDLPVPIPVPILSVSFDFYELFLLAMGEDPHPYQRLWILNETEALRDRLADESRARVLARAMQDLRPRLSRIWNDRRRPAPVRRRAIFEAWDECEEGTPEGEGARDAIESFVRDRLPCESRDAYTDEELEALNARRESAQEFAPYAEATPSSARPTVLPASP